MPRIHVSERYYEDYLECDVRECTRHYCPIHRLLWKDCDTAVRTHDGAGQVWYEVRDCPECMNERRIKHAAL